MPTARPAFTPKETPLVVLNPKKKAKKDCKGKEKEKETPFFFFISFIYTGKYNLAVIAIFR